MSRTRKQRNRSASSSCRNHGSCSYCHSNRTFQATKATAASLHDLMWDKFLIPEEKTITLRIEQTSEGANTTDDRSDQYSRCLHKDT